MTKTCSEVGLIGAMENHLAQIIDITVDYAITGHRMVPIQAPAGLTWNFGSGQKRPVRTDDFKMVNHGAGLDVVLTGRTRTCRYQEKKGGQ